MEWNGKKRLLTAIEGGATDRMPVISVCQYATYELMEATGAFWPEAHRDADKMARLSAGGATVLGLDAVRVPYCQTVEAEAYGAAIKDGGQKHIPSIDRPAFALGEEPKIPQDFLARGRIPAVIEAIRMLKAELGVKVAVMGSLVGPFSVAASLVGIAPFLKASLKKPDSLLPYLEAATKTAIQYAKAMTEAGADILVIEDMMASLDMISPRAYKKLAAPYEKQVIEAVGGTAPVILHICGKLDAVMTYIAETGVSAISVESAVDVPAALKKFHEAGIRTPILGAVHPIHALLEGTEEDVAAAVRKSSEDGVSVISPDCAVAPATTIANIKAMAEAAKKIENRG